MRRIILGLSFLAIFALGEYMSASNSYGQECEEIICA